MTQTSWLGDTTTRFRFYSNADAALLAYLTTSAPNGWAAYITSAITTLERNVLDFPAQAQSMFPVAYLWSVASQDAYHGPASPMVTVDSRFLVWDLDADLDDAFESVSGLCGALGSAILQSRDVTGNDWSDFYCNWDLPTVSVGPIQFIPTGDSAGLVQGSVVAHWTHDE